MKKLLPTLLTIILTVIIFSGCKFNILPYNDYDDLDTVKISNGETLYQSINEWTRFDSLTIDTADTTPRVWFTFQVHDSLFSKSFKEGDYETYYLDDSYMQFFCFTCLNIQSFPSSGDLCVIVYQVTFIANSGISMIMVDKPNIYLYPEKKTKMTVSLDLPEGGKVTESIPDYPKKWKNIRVKPDGTINNKYDFLFYEADLPNVWQYDAGWVIAQADLSFFFAMNLRDYGFNKKEIHDFVDYWIPRLNDAPYYAIWPQHTAQVDHVIPLKLSQQADSRLRLFYIIRDMTEYVELKEPNIPPFERKGFVVTEWGGSLE